MRSQAGKEKQGFVHEILSLKGMAQPEPSENMKARGKDAVKSSAHCRGPASAVLWTCCVPIGLLRSLL